MQQLLGGNSQKIVLLIGERGQREVLLDLTAVLGLRGPVRVLDAGNGFDPYMVTRAIRRQTARLYEVMERIYVARAFTCYQVITLLQQTPASPAPHLVFDLLATFADEAVTYRESVRLLQIGMAQLLRLREQAPVVVSARSGLAGQRAGLLRLLKRTADVVLLANAPAAVAAVERLL